VLFMVTWKGDQAAWMGVLQYWASLTPEQRADVGPGVKMIGRWHDTGGRRGCAILDADDAMALQSYAGQWSPHLDLEISPVVDDGQAAEIAAAVAAAQPPQ